MTKQFPGADEAVYSACENGLKQRLDMVWSGSTNEGSDHVDRHHHCVDFRVSGRGMAKKQGRQATFVRNAEARGAAAPVGCH
jgi:hypothetical protein